MAQQPVEHTALLITLLAIFAPLATAVFGYVLTTLHKNISAVDKSAKERHDAHDKEIRESEKRTTAYIHDVEARSVKRVEDAEARAEKGDAGILGIVNSQYSDVKTALAEMRTDLKAIRTGAGCSAQPCPLQPKVGS